MEKELVKNHLVIISKILWEDWDPIGINVIANAKDEYDSYAPKIYQMISRGDDYELVADYLTYVDTELIGNKPNMTRDIRVAKKLIDVLSK